MLVKEILNKLNDTDNDIYIPTQVNNYFSSGLNDQIAIGKFEKMKIYSNLYSNLKDIINKSLIFRAENFLETHMIDNKMKIMKEPKIDYKLVRKINPEFNVESFGNNPNFDYFLNL